MRYLILTILILIPAITMAQRSVREYPPSHRTALQAFLSKNSSYYFVPETWFDEDTLKAARDEWGFGKKFRPYYQAGDFNRDGKQDFAVVLVTGKNVDDPKSGMHVVVFNQVSPNSFKVVHIEHEDFSTAFFISTSKKGLYLGIMETDTCATFVPAGKGYIVEPCSN